MARIVAEINFRMRVHEKTRHAVEYVLQLNRTIKGFSIHSVTLSKENMQGLSPLLYNFLRASKNVQESEIQVAQSLWSISKSVGKPSAVFLVTFNSEAILLKVKSALKHEDIVFDITVL